MEPEYRVVYVGNGNLDAEEIRIFLESSGIHAYINQESVGITGYSLSVGSVGQAKVYVSADQYDEARLLLHDAEIRLGVVRHEHPQDRGRNRRNDHEEAEGNEAAIAEDRAEPTRLALRFLIWDCGALL